MINIKKESLCSGCSSCANSCPKKCISMVHDEEGFFYPLVNEAQCIHCNICISKCPIITKQTNKRDEENIHAFAAFSKNKQTRINSSSGGIFTEIASYILQNNGIVFGAAFSDNYKVKHIAISREDELFKLQGSKYVQSEIGNSYSVAKEFLQNGRLVLFSGTPCQISGLYSFLDKEYSNLITQDIICHGVPSPLVWEKYINYQQSLNNSKVEKISFRSKASGWKSYSMNFEFKNKSNYSQTFKKDLFMQGFLSNLYLRPSCYDCKFKGTVRPSDITLADFWGISDILPEMDDDKGTSLVFINSDKGQNILNEIKDNIIIKEVDKKKAILKDSSMIYSSKKPFRRNRFMKQIKTSDDFNRVLEKNIKEPFIYRALNKTLRILKIKKGVK